MRAQDLELGETWCKLFNTPDFKVEAVADVAGAELCGALKARDRLATARTPRSLALRQHTNLPTTLCRRTRTPTCA